MNQNTIEQLMHQAFTLFKQGKMTSAEQLLVHVCEQDPNNTNAHFLLCKIYAYRGNLNQAIIQAKKVVSLDADNGEAWLALSSFYADMGQFQQAEQASKIAINLLPHIPEAKINLVNTLISQNKHDDAIAMCHNIKDDNPANAGIWHSLGLAYKALNQINEADYCLTKVTMLDQNNAAALCTLGEIKVAQEDISQAHLYFEKSRELDPANPRVHFELGKVLLPNNSAKHWQLIQQLQKDYQYQDSKEATTIAKDLATDFHYGDADVEETLKQFFDNYEAATLYPANWWADVLKQFGDPRQALDTALRSIFASVFSWSLPSKEALDEIAAFSDKQLASYGSGSGYWEYLLAQHFDIDIKCHDMLLGHRFTPMKQQLHSEVTVDPEDSIFLAWIPGDSGIDTAIESLLNQTVVGQKLILVGEPIDEYGYPRTCGTHRFFRYLQDNFDLQKTIPLPNYAYFNDCVELLVRKTPAINPN